METIGALQDKALSGAEIQALIPYKVNIIKYKELSGVDHIEDLGPTVMLITTNREMTFGHWVAFFTDDYGDFQVFDSYNYAPDENLLFTPPQYRAAAGEDFPVLSALLLSWKQRHPTKNVVYNEHRLQSRAGGISTCGRHVALRLMFKGLSCGEYATMLKVLAKRLGHPVDWVVTLLTTPDMTSERMITAILDEKKSGGASRSRRTKRRGRSRRR